MLHRVAQLAELGREARIVPPGVSNDPWGTPYLIRMDERGYLVASAGSDRRFDESTWGVREQFTGLEGDVVIATGKVARTNRAWLREQVADDAARAALDELRKAEIELMMMRDPLIWGLLARQATESAIEDVAAYVATGADVPRDTRDMWGTALRVTRVGNNVRIVSAGADRTFEPFTWTQPVEPSLDEDIVYENGTFTRPLDREALFRRSARIVPKSLEQPPDARLSGTWPRVGGEVMPPAVTARVEPRYSEDYRRAGISGIVIVEALISETGAVQDVRVLKSVAPDLDTATVEAVRQWKFAPATVHGKPTPVIFNLTVNFKLRE
jgi:TonB family protein